jgi:uncharacterized protein YutE (UPF0331/DUF86 family)
MYNQKALTRVENIQKKINYIVSIAEQFDKLLHNGELEILSNFEKQDIKGSYDLRNYIAHDYEGVDLYIVENIIETRLPIILNRVNKILKEKN